MSKKATSTCPVCCKAYNDSLRLPLSSPCKHTHCLACLREHLAALHPGSEGSSESHLPTGREIECLKCQKTVSTDDFVINRSVLASVPLSLEDLIIQDYPSSKTPKEPSTSVTSPGAPATPQGPLYDPETTTHPEGPLYDPETTTHPEGPLDPGAIREQAYGTSLGFRKHKKKGDSLGPAGWTRPSSPPLQDPAMDPYQPHGTQGAVGWSVPQGNVNPQGPPPPPGSYTQMPQPYGHPHHGHGHAAAAGAAGVAAGAAAGAGVTALAHHKKKNKKDKKKNKKEKKHGKHRSRSSSRSSGSSSSSSSRSSSRSSRSSNSS